MKAEMKKSNKGLEKKDQASLFPVKIGFIIPIVLFMSSWTGCNVLDKDPVGTVTDDAVWSDQALVDAYTLEVYSEIEFIGGYGFESYNQVMDEVVGGEMTVPSWEWPYGVAHSVIDDGGLPGPFQEWPYSNIRRANYIIEQLEASEFDEVFIETRIAEMRFLRAFMYLEMVKRYGGVPLITEVQDMDAPDEEIFVSRNSEQEIYDFIAEEMDQIAEILPETAVSGEEGRATRGAALALKSRAMLYAASVAEFGDVQMDGLLGISSAEADNYWQAAYDASSELIQSGRYELYNEHADPAENYRQLFLTGIPDNSEAIFGEIFDGEGKAHSFTYLCLPPGYARGWGSNNGILYDIAELFDFEDGSPGRIPRNQLTSQEWTMEELFGTRDPRFRASVYYPESTIGDHTVHFHTSTLVNGEQITSGTVEGSWPASADAQNTNTGLHQRKRIDDSTQPTGHNTDQTDYIEFRLGEIYLNLAEAAFYLNRHGEALEYLNEIRSRAGMPLLDQVTEEIIRHERQVELAFEGHRYWDLRRWRIAVEELDGTRFQGLRYDFNWDTQKYRISLINAEGAPRVFQERHYYLPLGTGIVSENPNIVENPGYN